MPYYAWMSLAHVEAFVPLMVERGVSAVARSDRGFLSAYRLAGGTPGKMGKAVRPEGGSQRWVERRQNFIARHLAQGRVQEDPWWEDGEPTRRHLALIAWAFTPTPRRVANYLGKKSGRRS